MTANRSALTACLTFWLVVVGLALASPGQAQVDPGPFNTVIGTDGRDHLHGTPGRDHVIGLGGRDFIHRLGAGRDKVTSGPGNDRVDVQGGGRDRVSCGAGKRDRVFLSKNDRASDSCEFQGGFV